MDFLTVADVLAMPAVRSAGPRVAAGATWLHNPVRWVHSGELADIGPLLREGDLLLSTGIAMPDTDEGLRQVAASLSESGAAGLVVELGRRWTVLPRALVQACDNHRLPLIALVREARFATLAQAVGERIVEEQLAELRETQRVHDTFTDLGIAEAGPGEILDAVQRLAGAAVILESEQHHVLDYRSGADDLAPALADWARTARSMPLDGRTGWDGERGWLITRVGRHDRGWGRLAIQSRTTPSRRQVAIVERAAAALALHRLHDRHRDNVVRRTHHELLLALLANPASEEVLRRCGLAGLPVRRRQFVGLTLRPIVAAASADQPRRPQLDEITAAVVHAAHEARVPALVSDVDGDVRALLSLPLAAEPDHVVDDLATRVRHRQDVVIGVGLTTVRAGDIDRTLQESQQVVGSVGPGGEALGGVYRLDDVHLRGLLAMLADDHRVQAFVRRELAALKEHDMRRNTGLLDAVRALLRHPTSKSDAAASLHISRPVFYDRLGRAARLLDADLDDADTRVSLQVAMIADEIANGNVA
ncbi:PucR family transcriptional regulator [Jiangella gansuensis]|uniref:PucR family transcriptional regulator n=1 Tax=Jiangella gansuensis TaxID=281473 RepID=UPI0004B621D0|nr:PucR family transcriptional regulator ligand-binding domain-containing protein [Jiangella gansuensis]